MSVRIVHPRVLENRDIEAIANKRTQAHTELSKLCSGERKWTMCVPVQDDDTDVLLGQALRDSQRLEQEVYRLRGEIKQLLIHQKDEMTDEIHAALMAIVFEGETSNA